MPKLETIVVCATPKTGIKFLNNEDPAIKAIIHETNFKQRMQKVVKIARMSWPMTSVDEIERYKIRAKRNELTRWANLTSQGKAVRSFEGDRIANCWLSYPYKHTVALKFCANVAVDKVALARAKIKEDVACRKCRVQCETLGHILSQCSSTKKERIARHDTIKDFMLKRIVENDADAVVTREQSLQLPHGEVLKPDLVIQNKEGAFVVDITVRHEDGDNLHRGRLSKIEKYRPLLLPDLQRRYITNKAEVLPIVTGTREANNQLLKNTECQRCH
jgi:hypothetical protein